MEEGLFFIQLTLSERKGVKNSGLLYTVDIHSDRIK